MLYGCIIQDAARGCASGCNFNESVDHLFLHCHVFGQVWYLVCHWLGVHSVNPISISDHYLQFRTCSGFARSKCSFMHLMWFGSIWVIWKERNARLFRAKEATCISC